MSLALLATAGTTLGLAGTALPTSATVKAHLQPAKKIKPDIAYFAGKTITFVNGSAPGAGGDTYARPLAPFIASYLHATVNIINQTGSGSISSQNFVANSVPNGLTIGELTVGSNFDGDVYDTAVPSFSMQALPLLGGAAPSSGSILVANPSSPVTTLKEFVKSAAAEPTLDITPGAADLDMRIFDAAYKVPVSYVTGYASDAALASGFYRGDAPFAVSGSNSLLPFVNSGQARTLLLFRDSSWPQDVSGFAKERHVDNLEKYATENPPKGASAKAAIKALEDLLKVPTYAFFAPAGTPADIVLALSDAIRSAMAQPGVKNVYLASGNPTGFVSPDKLLSEIRAVSNRIPTMKAFVTSG
jgi:tripartite-type tricarboxylate transporter receptor subunit TctC